MEILSVQIESLIFASDRAVSITQIKKCLDTHYNQTFEEEYIQEIIDALIEKYSSTTFSMELVAIADGFKFQTKPIFHDVIASFLKMESKKKLSRAALETLAIVAYKQPITRIDLESIRGVNCEYAIQKLLEKELVEINGRENSPGRPLIYATSEKFMDYFGLKSIKDLPKIKDLSKAENEIGEKASMEESISLKQEEE